MKSLGVLLFCAGSESGEGGDWVLGGIEGGELAVGMYYMREE